MMNKKKAEEKALLQAMEAMSRKAAADKKAERENKKTKKSESKKHFFLDHIK